MKYRQTRQELDQQEGEVRRMQRVRRKRPFVYKPRLSTRQKWVIDALRPLAKERICTALQQVHVSPLDDDDDRLAVSFVTDEGTATITTPRATIVNLAICLIHAADSEFVGAQIDV